MVPDTLISVVETTFETTSSPFAVMVTEGVEDKRLFGPTKTISVGLPKLLETKIVEEVVPLTSNEVAGDVVPIPTFPSLFMYILNSPLVPSHLRKAISP